MGAMCVILTALQAAFVLRSETANGFSFRCRPPDTTTALLARHARRTTDDTGLTLDTMREEITHTSRRELLSGSITAVASGLFLLPTAAVSKCTDIESCREVSVISACRRVGVSACLSCTLC